MRQARRIGVATLLAALGVVPGRAYAADADRDASRAASEITSVDRESAGIQAAIDRSKTQRYTLEQRLASAELLYRGKEYHRAIVVFSEILEEAPDSRSAADALWLRGEAFYEQHDYLAARRDYRTILDHAQDPKFASYIGRALGRIVDVALRTGDLRGLDDFFKRVNEVPSGQADAALSYARGKAHYFRGEYNDARTALAAVPNTAEHAHQARYFQGLVAMREARPVITVPPAGTLPIAPAGSADAPRAPKTNFKAAIDAFKAATDLPPDTAEHRHVIDLAWMAIGRLHYEMENFTQAADAYSKVGRESPEFATMLYELAWVYVRLGDVQRAERALEVLAIADPSSPMVSDGTLLRADLLLRAGSFDKSLQLYTSVRDEYEPMRARLEAFIDATQDPAVYYDKIAQQQMDLLDQSEQLPPIAIRWAREAEDGPLAFAVVDDVNQCKQLLRESYQLAEKLTVILAASNRVRAFPELAAGEQRALELLNRISKMRLALAKGMDDEEPKELGGEIGQVRAQRRQAQGLIAQLPTEPNAFADRDYQGQKQWNTVSQELSRRNVEIDYLNATINGLRRWLREDSQRGVARDPATLKRFNDELDDNERLLKQRRQEADDLRRSIEIGRAQIGIGDARYQNDAVARAEFRDALEREVRLAEAGQANGDAQKYASKVRGALEQARAVEDRLIAKFGEMEAMVAQRASEVQAKVDAERSKIDSYNMTLGTYDTEARDLVGQVAKRNFGLVRDRLRNTVLRADVGITEQAWEVREEELDRVHNLQTERAREEQLLDEELREVLDDAADTRSQAK